MDPLIRAKESSKYRHIFSQYHIIKKFECFIKKWLDPEIKNKYNLVKSKHLVVINHGIHGDSDSCDGITDDDYMEKLHYCTDVFFMLPKTASLNEISLNFGCNKDNSCTECYNNHKFYGIKIVEDSCSWFDERINDNEFENFSVDILKQLVDKGEYNWDDFT